MRLIPAQLQRFCGAGVVGAILYCVVLLGLTEIAHVWYPVSATVAYVLNVISNFLFHRHWTFQAGRQGRLWLQAFQYFGLSLVLCPMNAVLMYLMTESTILPYWVAQVIVTTILYLSFYPVNRRIFAN